MRRFSVWSLGVSIMLGRGRSTAEQILDNVRIVCDATSLPVNADLEDCFATAPKEAATMMMGVMKPHSSQTSRVISKRVEDPRIWLTWHAIWAL